MSAAREALRARRAQLAAQAGEERDELALAFAPLESHIETVSRLVGIVRTVRKYSRPLATAVGVGMAALAVVRPASIVGWVGAAQTVWNVVAGIGRRTRAAE